MAPGTSGDAQPEVINISQLSDSETLLEHRKDP